MKIVLYTKDPHLMAYQRHSREGVFLIVTDPLHRKPFQRQVSYQGDSMGTISAFI